MFKFNLNPKNKRIFLFVVTLALLGGVFYGGYRYWQNRKPVSDPQKPSTEEPVEEEAYEIINNSDGSYTFVCYKFGFKFDYPEGWEFSERYSNLRGATGSDDVGAVEIIRDNDWECSVLFSILLPRDESRFSTLRDFLVYLDEGSEIPSEPNYNISGISAFKYTFWGHPDANDTLIITLEYKKRTFEISIPLENQNDLEYLGIIDSFEFIE